MKILLVYPNKQCENEMPLGLGYLASFILEKNNDVEIKVLDTRIAKEEEVGALLADRYDLVGITVTSRTYREAVELTNRLKRSTFGTPVVFGGPHVSIMMEQVLHEPLIDLAVYGEGELTFDELVKLLKSGKDITDERNLKEIRGLIYRENGQAARTDARELIKDLDALPFPAFHLFGVERYPGKYPIITSRGCPFSCVFCASSLIWGRKWRARSPENVIAEVQYIISNFGPKPVDFHDDGFNMSLQRVNAICDLFINEKIKIPWGVRGLRVDMVDAETARKMRRAGCSHVAIGVESANRQVLEKIRKKESIEQVKEGVKYLRAAGIDVIGHFMIGNPGETLETVKESIKFAQECGFIKALFGTAVPFPRTDLWNYVQKHGEFLVEPDCTRFEELEPRIIFDTPEFGKEQRLVAVKLAEKAGMLSLMKRRAHLAHVVQSAVLSVWFKYFHRHLPPSISYHMYFFFRRVRALLRSLTRKV